MHARLRVWEEEGGPELGEFSRRLFGCVGLGQPVVALSLLVVPGLACRVARGWKVG